MGLDEKRIKRWLEQFGLITMKGQRNHTHVSGRGDGMLIKQVIEGSKSKSLVPVHTVHEAYQQKWHKNEKKVKLNGSIQF